MHYQSHKNAPETLEWPGDAVKEVRLVNRRSKINQVHRLVLFPFPDV